jgi:tetratricopeptide (TPR) repeat protein/lysophospholipase L1-like esterase
VTNSDQNPPRAELEKLLALYQQRQFAAFAAGVDAQLAEFPGSALLHNLRGVAVASLGKPEEAIGSYQAAVELKPDYPDAWNNLGNAYKETGDPDKAAGCIEKALQLNPQYAAAWNNMAGVMEVKGENQAALESYNQAIQLNNNFPEAWNNRGVLLLNAGNINQAFNDFGSAVKLQGSFIEAFANLYELLLQFINTPAFADYHGLAPGPIHYQSALAAKFHTLAAIAAWLRQDREGCAEHVQQLQSAGEQGLQGLSDSDRQFCTAYGRFLQALLRFPAEGQTAAATLFHLGESHCLSYAHQTLSLAEEQYTIQPRLCLGAKAFHLAANNGNRYQAMVAAQMAALPGASAVLLSFGEIDCRLDEGFLPAHQKRGGRLEAMVEETVCGYLDFLQQAASRYKHRLLVMNVPAPVFNDQHSAASNGQRADLIRLFNQTLEQQARARALSVIDVHTASVGEDGFANTEHHLDGIHLGPSMLPVLEEQLQKQLQKPLAG